MTMLWARVGCPNIFDTRGTLREGDSTWCVSHLCVCSEVQEGTDDVSYQHPMIPCEFCLELFDEHTIAEHQVSVPGCDFLH